MTGILKQHPNEQYIVTSVFIIMRVYCILRNLHQINTVDSRYNDTVGIREKYRYIQTINISSSIEYLVMAGILK